MNVTVTELRKSRGKDKAELVNESKMAGNMHTLQYGRSVHKEQKSLTKSREDEWIASK